MSLHFYADFTCCYICNLLHLYQTEIIQAHEKKKKGGNRDSKVGIAQDATRTGAGYCRVEEYHWKKKSTQNFFLLEWQHYLNNPWLNRRCFMVRVLADPLA
jgi:hypothetical protein